MVQDPLFYALAVPAVVLMGLAKGGFSGVGAVSMPLLAMAISPVKAAAILLELKRRHLLVSTRGRFGGYALARPAAEISFADVIRALDGPLALAPCASKTAYRPCETCPNVEDCPVHPALVKAREAMAEVLESWSLATAVRKGAPFPT